MATKLRRSLCKVTRYHSDTTGAYFLLSIYKEVILCLSFRWASLLSLEWPKKEKSVFQRGLLKGNRQEEVSEGVPWHEACCSPHLPSGTGCLEFGPLVSRMDFQSS